MEFKREQVDRAVRMLKALSHPIRLQIVALLTSREAHVSSLAEELGSSQSVVSQQLRILRMSGLVQTERINGYSVYRLSEDHLRDLIRCMHGCCAVS